MLHYRWIALTVSLIGWGATSTSASAQLRAGHFFDKSLDDVKVALSHDHPKVRLEAVRALGFWLARPEAHPALLIALRPVTDDDRYSCGSNALGKYVAEAGKHAPLLIKALGDPVVEVRFQAAFCVWGVGSPAKGAIPALVRLMQDPNAKVGTRAIEALGAFGSDAKAAIGPLIAALRSRHMEVQAAACTTLGYIGPAASEAILPLIELLGHRTHGSTAATALGAVGVKAVAPLIEVLGDADPARRWGAALALGEIGPEAKLAVLALMERTDDKHREVALEAVKSLGHIGPAAEAAIPGLLEKLGADDKTMGKCSARALAKIGAAAGRPLLEALQSKNETIRARAALGLSRLEVKAAPEAIKLLLAALKDENTEVRMSAVVALSRWATPDVCVPAIVPLLDDAEVESQVVRVLHEMGANARPALPDLVRVRKKVSPQDSATTREFDITCAINDILGVQQPTLPYLVQSLDHLDAGVRTYVADLLKSWGSSLVPQLMETLKDEKGAIRRASAKALGDCRDEAKAAVPRLIMLLFDEDAPVRDAAALALEKITASPPK